MQLTASRPSTEPLAIVGSGCRFAGDVDSPSALWKLLKDPKELVTEIPSNRYNAKGFHHPDGEHNGTTDASYAYFISQNHKHFDANFFSIRAKEAEAIDPQQRMLLEVVYEALESTGYTIDNFSGKSVAVYAGVMTADYDTVSQRDDLNTSQYYATGNARSIVANRISYFFNWHGPSLTIDTACSSSLVALDQAVNNLRAGRCDVACVTGANLILTPEQFIAESSLHMLSPEGHSRMWDTGANGYARGEGVAAIFVKTLRQALADGDRIEAVIRDIGTNSDGRTPGLTMPSHAAQTQLIQDVYFRAGLDPNVPSGRCQYFEAHGTGTPRGDPIEAEAIQNAFFSEEKKRVDLPTSRRNQAGLSPESTYDEEPDTGKMLVGSIKTVLGHTEGAAGLAGVLKVVQMMRHGKVAPNLHLEQLNPEVAKRAPDLVVPTQLQDWPQVPPNQPKRASVNSFGFGGTNAHVILEQYHGDYHNDLIGFLPTIDGPPSPKDPSPVKGVDGPLLLPLFLSANTKDSLVRLAEVYRNHIISQGDNDNPVVQHDLNELAWHLFSRRTASTIRCFVSGSSREDLAKGLNEVIADVENPNPRAPLISRALERNRKPKILGVFTGQGAQWATMGLQLMKTSKRFHETIKQCDGYLQSLRDRPDWTLEEEMSKPAGQSRVGEPQIAQPLSTAVQVALVQLLTYMGVELTAVVGHSSGEIAAAFAAGRISAEHAMVISYYRGKYAYLAKNPVNDAKGDMIVTALSPEAAAELVDQPKYRNRLWVAAINHPELVTLSGDVSAVAEVATELKERKAWTRMLGVGIAYHSDHMLEPSEAYRKVLQESKLRPLPFPRYHSVHPEYRRPIPWYSTVTAANAEDLPNGDLKAEYWGLNMISPVNFLGGLRAAKEGDNYDLVIEVGPHPALRSMVDMVLKGNNSNAIPYTSLLFRGLDDRLAFAKFLGFMWTHFKWYELLLATYVSDSSDPGLPRKPRLEGLPLYPWDHSQEFYRESRVARQYHQRKEPQELLGVRGRDDNDSLLRWRNVLLIEQLPWGTGHTFQGMHLVPASGYCSMAYDAAKVVLAGRSASIIELLDLHFWSGITLEPGSPGVETLFSLTIENATQEKPSQSEIHASFTLTSCPADGSTDMKMNFSGKMRIVLGEPSLDALPERVKVAEETTEADAAAFYHMMRGTGLEYSGPFKGLTSLRKRWEFASGTVKQLHDEDGTELTISPATLDSCLQTAFVTVSSPGDGSLWTAFLPEKITRMRFNVASCEGKNNSDMLTVDAYLTDSTTYTRETRASFTADIEIFGQEDRLQVLVEGLTVTSFATTKPEDDYEMYLTTVYDVDADEEIVTAANVPPPEQAKLSLVESCERVAAFYETGTTTVVHPVKLPEPYWVQEMMGSTTMRVNGWPDETAETLDAFIKQSRYFETLETIRQLGQMGGASLIRTMLPGFMVDTHWLVAFQDHVSRIVKQIAHKYPRMNILALTNPELGLNAPVLNGLDSAFLSYRVGATPDKYHEERVLTTPARRKKVTIAHFGFSEEPDSSVLYDLVLVTTSMITTFRERALRAIRSVMRPGGFLVLLDYSVPPLLGRFTATAMGLAVAGPVDWNDLLLRSGFTDAIRNSNQNLDPGYSITVRHANSASKTVYQDPFKAISDTTVLADNVLIVGGQNTWTGSAERNIATLLAPHCTGEIHTAHSLVEVDTARVHEYTAVIMLADFDTPVLSNLTAEGMEGFARLVLPHPGANAEDQDPLFTYETEVYMDRQVPTVARCLPWKAANNRFNAPRRHVTDPLDSLDSVVEVGYYQQDVEDVGSGGYRMKVDRSYHPQKVADTTAVIKVAYSTADALELYTYGGSGYISMGRHVQEDKVYVAWSTVNASYLRQRRVRYCTHRPEFDTINQPLFVSLLSRFIIAKDIAKTIALGEAVILVEPDAMLQFCISDVLAGKGVPILVVSTDAAACASDPDLVFVHANSSTRDIKALYRRGANLSNATLDKVHIIDLLPPGSEITRILRRDLPRGWRYDRACDLISQQSYVHDVAPFPPDEWQNILNMTQDKMSLWHDNTAFVPQRISIPALTQRSSQLPPFHLIDWKADRSLEGPVNYMPAREVLSRKKTYIMVGITRDFGQSLSYLFANYGARHIILCSRSPPGRTDWQDIMRKTRGVTVEFYPMDVTNPQAVARFAQHVEIERKLVVGGVINGAMVLEDKVFSTMSIETFHRVMRPKTIGSKNLDIAFRGKEMEFFIMTSSFAAIGGHAGQSNYAAANMFMNGLAAKRRAEGFAASTLNIGVIYGIGFLHREKSDLYQGLEREGYPPISERDIHHMFIEAIAAGKPKQPGAVNDIITGLSRYDVKNPQHSWQQDPRFSHFTKPELDDESAENVDEAGNIKELLKNASTVEEAHGIINSAFTKHMADLLKLSDVSDQSTFGELGIDSLAAVDVRNWFYKNLAFDVAIMKIL
ncbi:Nonribosomal peptide synthetase 14, partial [Naviculisporaceae sp. PSN 640]